MKKQELDYEVTREAKRQLAIEKEKERLKWEWFSNIDYVTAKIAIVCVLIVIGSMALALIGCIMLIIPIVGLFGLLLIGPAIIIGFYALWGVIIFTLLIAVEYAYKKSH